jgi:CCDC81-like prokaryotic HU domain 2
MLRDLFFRYLAQHQSGCIEGVGMLYAGQTVIQTDITNQLLHPPGTGWQFTPGAACGHDHHFIQYIARQKNIPETDAMELFARFSQDVVTELRNGGTVDIPHVGHMTMTATGDVEFVPAKRNVFLQPVSASRIIRKNEVHSLVVGENERTSTEMAQLLQDAPAPPRSRWWIAALLIALGSIALIAVHFSKSASPGNRQPVSIKK